jgi:excisionase family DNA binding protein
MNEKSHSPANTPLPAATAATVETVEPFIKKPEVAKRLGRTVRTVDAMMRRGQIPYYKFGYSVAFRWSEITNHLAQTCRICRS